MNAGDLLQKHKTKHWGRKRGKNKGVIREREREREAARGYMRRGDAVGGQYGSEKMLCLAQAQRMLVDCALKLRELSSKDRKMFRED